jgi:hypothetical protein
MIIQIAELDGLAGADVAAVGAWTQVALSCPVIAASTVVIAEAGRTGQLVSRVDPFAGLPDLLGQRAVPGA